MPITCTVSLSPPQHFPLLDVKWTSMGGDVRDVEVNLSLCLNLVSMQWFSRGALDPPQYFHLVE